ncbi:MAG: methionine adenosyltransferase, partial [Chloroflexi bacterium]|nr:methionine adenosyltransferase [Chloroflexota bacterium]
MAPSTYLLTSESVTEGHPDKLCDQVSDGVLDAIFAQDPQARVACETACTTGVMFVFGEITTTAYVDIASVAREVIRDVGYTSPEYGFDAETAGVLVSIKERSPAI